MAKTTKESAIVLGNSSNELQEYRGGIISGIPSSSYNGNAWFFENAMFSQTCSQLHRPIETKASFSATRVTCDGNVINGNINCNAWLPGVNASFSKNYTQFPSPSESNVLHNGNSMKHDSGRIRVASVMNRNTLLPSKNTGFHENFTQFPSPIESEALYNDAGVMRGTHVTHDSSKMGNVGMIRGNIWSSYKNASFSQNCNQVARPSESKGLCTGSSMVRDASLIRDTGKMHETRPTSRSNVLQSRTFPDMRGRLTLVNESNHEQMVPDRNREEACSRLYQADCSQSKAAFHGWNCLLT